MADGLPENYRLRVDDAWSLDFPDSMFDLLVSNFMYDLLAGVRLSPRACRVLQARKPVGRIALVNVARTDRWSQRLDEWAYRLSPMLLDGCRRVGLAPFLGIDASRMQPASGVTRSVLREIDKPTA